MENNIESSGKINPETLKEKIELSGKVLRQLALWGIMTLGPLQGLEAKTIADDTNDGVKIEKNITSEHIIAVVEDQNKEPGDFEIQKTANVLLTSYIRSSILEINDIKIASRPDINNTFVSKEIEKLAKEESDWSSNGYTQAEYYLVVDSNIYDLDSKIVGNLYVNVIDLKTGENYSFISSIENVTTTDSLVSTLESKGEKFSKVIVDKIKKNTLSELESGVYNLIK